MTAVYDALARGLAPGSTHVDLLPDEGDEGTPVNPDHFLKRHLVGRSRTEAAMAPWVLKEYRRCHRKPAMRHAACEDFRVAAGIALEHDAEDAGERITAPLLAPWGARGVVGQTYDVLATWREKAIDVRGHAIDCGHLVQEEASEALLEACALFLR